MTTANRRRYVTAIPSKLPAGQVLVHNSSRPLKPLGGGFQTWTQKLSDGLMLCDCKWASGDLHGMQHYRHGRPNYA
jgi:hypothetical protein